MSEKELPRDEFSTAIRKLSGNQGAIRKESTIHLEDDYGNLATWVVVSFRQDGRSTVLVQRSSSEPLRVVLPPAVTAALERHALSSVEVARRRGAASAAAKRAAAGIAPDVSALHTPEARRKAAATRRAKAVKRAGRVR